MNYTSFNNIFSRPFFKLSFALALAGSNISYAIDSKVTVLVIDQGIDFENNLLRKNKHLLAEEEKGLPGVDDNQDGFKDNVSGWNQVSNDEIYMPPYVLETFTQDAARTKSDLAIYSGIENRNLESIQKFMADKELQRRVSQLLQYAHGTHVAGIIGQQANDSAFIHSFNIFNGSTPDSDTSSVLLANKINAAFDLESLDLNRILHDSKLDDSSDSLFDNKIILQMIADDRAKSNAEFMNLIDTYIQKLNPRVVNLSFGFAYLNLIDQLLQVWSMELRERGLPSNTVMSATQKANLAWLAKTIFTNAKTEWIRVFGKNTNTLFVAAAGNDGRGPGSDYGNLDVYDALPASLAELMPNLVTVVATGNENKIADFSSFSKRRTTLGAPGVAMVSTAPGEHEVAMSGTSMASPFVAGLGARVFQLNPQLTPAQVKTLMAKSVTLAPSLKEKTASGGVINKEILFNLSERTKNESFEKVISDVSAIPASKNLFETIFRTDPMGTRDFSLDDGSLVHRTSEIVKNMIRKM